MSLAKKTACLPPKNFRPAGVVTWAQWSPDPPPFINTKRRRGRRAEGIRYERKAHDYFEEVYEDSYVASPWFHFQEVGVEKVRWCQPDALIIRPHDGRIDLLEYKLQHTSDAWWQLRWLYLPVVSRLFPTDQWEFNICEVCKWYDCATIFPEKVSMCADLDQMKPGAFNMHIWKS